MIFIFFLLLGIPEIIVLPIALNNTDIKDIAFLSRIKDNIISQLLKLDCSSLFQRLSNATIFMIHLLTRLSFIIYFAFSKEISQSLL